MTGAIPAPSKERHDLVNHEESAQEEPGFDHSSNTSEKDFPGPTSPSSESSKESDHDGHFFDRLYAIPLVAESLDFVSKYANDDDKAYSKYLKFALAQAEVGLNKVTHIAEAKFPDQFNKADHMAVSTLDYLEGKFPAVKKTTSSDVYNSSRQAISGIVATPQAALNSTIDSIATNAETILDRFLPADHEAETETEMGCKDGVARLRHVGVDATRRLSHVVRTQIDTISSSSSQVPLLNLKDSSKILERATQEVATLSEKLAQVMAQTKDNVSSYKKSGLDIIQVYQASLVAHLSFEYEHVASYLKSHSASMPDSVRAHLEPSFNFITERCSKVSAELYNNDHSPAEKASTALLLATESVPYLEDICRYLSTYLAKVSS